jgi:hypothetical protein
VFDAMSCLMTNGVCPIDDSGSCCGREHQMKVVACIPVLGRLPLLRHTIERLYKKNKVHKVICSGDGHQERKLVESLGAEWVQHRNRPLGQKWNAAFQAAEKYKPDACLFVGSSDWLSDNWLTEMGPHLKEHDLLGTAGCFFLHVDHEFKMCYWPGYVGRREGESIGIGRIISSRVLDKLQWKPFNEQLDASLDHSMQQRVKQVAGSTHLVSSDRLKSLSISTSQWVNKHKFFDHYTGKYPSTVIHSPLPFLQQHFPEAELIFPKPLTLHVEEADSFAPRNPQPQ